MKTTVLAITVSMLAVTAHGQGLSNRVTTLETNDSAQDLRLDALESAPAGSGGIQVLANGVSIGLSTDAGGGNGRGLSGYRVLSDKDYLFSVIALVNGDETLPCCDRPSVPGDLSTDVVWFAAPGCANQAYATIPGGTLLQPLDVHQGFVFRSDDPTDPIQHYYVAAGTIAADTTLASRRTFQEGGCVTFGEPPVNRSVQVFLNDPNITGVPNSSFTAPISLGH